MSSHEKTSRQKYCMIGLNLHMAGDESRMAGDCCRTEGIQPGLYIDAYVHIYTCMTIYMALWYS